MATKEQTAEMIKVMQAYVDGKKIQVTDNGVDWVDLASPPYPHWDWSNYQYRIKPEPKIIYVNEYTGFMTAYPNPIDAKDGASFLGDKGRAIAVEYVRLSDVKELK